jgi:zinc dependent phospholipase C
MTRTVACALILVALVPGQARAYSVLAHEATVDVAWERGIRPLLVRRFPRTTDDALLRARSFAYGGSVIQDLGYYPFGNKFFSNLLHYVRSGDFVEALVRDAGDVDEYAFALGALAHYANDNTGHPEAVNRAVPMVYPKLRARFGDTVTYIDAPKQHVIVEFSFDIVQAAGGAYLPAAYQSFIGFRVASPLLERAFRDTYGLEMQDIFGDEERAINTYRYAVSQLIPELTRAAWRDKHDEIVKLTPTLQQTGFVFAYGRREFERAYGSSYQKPGWLARFLGVVYRLVPKVGPLKPLAFKAPTPEAEALFARSFKQASSRFQALLADLSDDRVELRNTDFDTGQASRHGEYALADDTYAELLQRFRDRQFAGMPAELRAEVRRFYGARPVPSMAAKKDRKHWDQIEQALRMLAPAK